MTDARTFIKPKYRFFRSSDCISLQRDNYLLRIYPSQLKFQLDRITDEGQTPVDVEFKKIQRNSKFQKAIFGVFGYIKLKSVSYLIMIEEASIVGEILKGLVYRVEKLMFIPMNLVEKGDMKIHKED